MNKAASFFARQIFLWVAFFIALAAWPMAAGAGEPPAEPVLRIETGMHTATISRIGVDSMNRFLVTASDDKTIRVWDLPTGKLLKIIRPPLGEGNEGKLYSAAISPDGRTIAAGGWTGWDWEGKSYIYFFDRETGALIKRIAGLPNVTFNLVYSKDGRYLAASLGSYGVKVWRAVDYKLVGEDTAYDERSSWADFDANNRLVTACYDGYVRLYEIDESAYPALKLIIKVKPPDAGQVFSTAFSPDGSKISVGFNDSLKVNVLSGKDLSHLYSPDTSDLTNGNLAVTAWSADGRHLYAGKALWGWFIIRKWADAGRRSHTDLSAAENSIRHIVGLNNGGIAYGSYDPAFGVYDASGKRVVYQPPFIADYRENKKGLMLSNDGMTVQFGYELWGESQARFSIKDRVLTDAGTPPAETLSQPLAYADGINVTNWKNVLGPELNGRKLDVEANDRSRSLAVAQDGQSFLLGTEWRVRLFDRSGAQRWEADTPSAAWAVNISGNGKAAVAAFGDGTIRWYRMTDGKEMLSFFPHGDRKRWVVWTPSGYYDASSGADDLIGWHINNGKDQAADFFPAGRFRSTFYRADVVAKVLTTLDEAAAIRLANEESGKRTQQVSIEKALPPIVTILEPRDSQAVSSKVITVRYAVRSPSGEPVTGVKALVDGRPVAMQKGVQVVARDKDKDVREMQVALPDKDSEISIIAENRFTSSEPATVRIKWSGTASGDDFIIKPKLYVLAIGVSKYHDKNLTLVLASKDAQDFADALSRQKDGIYRDVAVKVLTDETATKDEILDGLEWIQRETTSKDVAMVFLSGHGVNDSSGVYYYLPVGVQTDKLKRTAVAFSDIKNTVASLAGKTVLFVDTCHSGNIMGTRRGIADINAVVNELSSAENGAVVFASSTGNQYSLENAAWGNGAFTKALVEGLNGKADYTGKGKISVNMLDLYISERVKELTKGSQTPTTTKPATVSDFPVAVSR
ncbi:MAG: caspase family protein [Deltaproteobacteria bacterium]|nr:caspase family protein [Deltaproteobacteria bacterium]